ncbi:MAG: ATP-binding cassette domain-containing protein [Variibacter sp.]
MLARPSSAVIVTLVVLAGVAAAVPLFGGTYALKFVTRVMVLAILVLSLDFLIGISGLVSFGHAMFFGLGAYAVYFLSPADAGASVIVAFGGAMLGAGVAALAVGALAVLTRGFYFIMVTLAFGEMAFALFHDGGFSGGSDGAYINVKPQLSIGDVTLLDLDRRIVFFYFCLALLIVCYVSLLAIARGPVGRVLQGIRWNETRIAALGYDTYAHKLVAFTLAGSIAGLAGALFATIDGYVTPDLFGWRQSGLAIMMAVLGGVGTLFGAILGAILYAGLEELLKSASLVGPLAEHWSLALGAILIAAVLAVPRGIAGLFPATSNALQIFPTQSTVRASRAEEGRSGLAVSTTSLTRRFGGLLAVDGVTLGFAPDKVHAVIGPNGAGKTTFINMLSGALPPTSGHIAVDGADVTGRPLHAMARLGIGRSYQITNVILPFTAWENCLLAAQARQPSPMRMSSRGQRGQIEADIRAALDAVGLAQRAGAKAADLSHGEQRQLEIAMLIAMGARVLILDEPLAGMGPEETGRVTALLRRLAARHTVILIEHDMDAVFAAADTLTVLVGGRLLAHGAPDAIRPDASVREAYLGQWDTAAQTAPARRPAPSAVIGLEAEGLNTFYGQSHILHDVDFRVAPGETVSLLGRNGMGKTTLLRTLMGLTPARSGSIRLGARDIAGARPSVVARAGLAFVPEGRSIFPNLTVEENLTVAATGRPGQAPQWTLARIYSLFPRLAERRGNWGNQLSGGEQKMLAIARALMTNPGILLLDEATEGLAPKVREEIWATIRAIGEAGIATVVVDKNLSDLLVLANRHVILSKGRVVFDGSAAELQADSGFIHSHLGV